MYSTTYDVWFLISPELMKVLFASSRSGLVRQSMYCTVLYIKEARRWHRWPRYIMYCLYHKYIGRMNQG